MQPKMAKLNYNFCMITTLTANHKILQRDPELSKCNSFNWGVLSQLLYDTKTTREKSHVDFAMHAQPSPPKTTEECQIRV
jgi:hypothetical protein